MAVSFRESSTADWNAASGNVPKPTGTVENDGLLTLVMTDGPNSVTPPSGWTLEEGPIDSGGNYRGWVYSKVAGASEPANYGWAGTDAHWSFICLAYSGIDTAALVNQANSELSSELTTVPSPSITPSVNNCMIVALYGIRADGLLPATPDSSPAATERREFTGTGGSPALNLYAQDFLQGTAAAVSLDATFSLAGAWCAFTLALKESGGAAAPVPKLRLVQSNLRW